VSSDMGSAIADGGVTLSGGTGGGATVICEADAELAAEGASFVVVAPAGLCIG
jgi:hypothetical protein